MNPREEGRLKTDVKTEGDGEVEEEIAKAALWAISMPAKIQLDTAQENDRQTDRADSLGDSQRVQLHWSAVMKSLVSK